MIPLPHQITGAHFLAKRRTALLADEPRVGKTGAAIMAADLILARSILVVTTASGRAVWRRAVRDWSGLGRTVTLVDPARWQGQNLNGVVVVSWKTCTNPEIRALFMTRSWDVVILDECHYAKNFETQRTQAIYGHITDDGEQYDKSRSAIQNTKRVWLLSGTPAPNSIIDLYPHIRTLFPHTLLAGNGRPDVMAFERFIGRYARVGYKKLSRFNKIRVILEGRNEDELKARIGSDFMLRRTQQDVGIAAPIYEIWPLEVSRSSRAEIDKIPNVKRILEAARLGQTKALEKELHLAKIRRATGTAKAGALVEAIKEEFENGLDKIVVMAWHHDVIALLLVGLEAFGARVISGKTPELDREANADAFRDDPTCRVIVGQIQAAGEAIDLSPAAELVFCESSTIPKDMKQASLRITNHKQTRQTRVRVAVIDGSWDDQVETILLRKWASIREVIS